MQIHSRGPFYNTEGEEVNVSFLAANPDFLNLVSPCISNFKLLSVLRLSATYPFIPSLQPRENTFIVFTPRRSFVYSPHQLLQLYLLGVFTIPRFKNFKQLSCPPLRCFPLHCCAHTSTEAQAPLPHFISLYHSPRQHSSPPPACFNNLTHVSFLPFFLNLKVGSTCKLGGGWEKGEKEGQGRQRES